MHPKIRFTVVIETSEDDRDLVLGTLQELLSVASQKHGGKVKTRLVEATAEVDYPLIDQVVYAGKVETSAID